MAVANWEEHKLSDVCDKIFSGGTPSTKEAEYWNGEFNWLSSGETGNRLITKTDKKITRAGIDNSSTRLAKKRDVVIASAGQGATRGQTSYLLIDTYVNQSVIVLTTQASKLDPLFLFYNLTSRYNQLRSLSDSNSSRGSLTCKMLEGLSIRMPEINEQKKIATVLSEYDWLIENNNRRIQILERMTELIYTEWFIKFKFPGREKSNLVSSALGEIPEGWDVVKVGKRFSVVLGGTPSRDKTEFWGGSIPWINSGKINELRIIDHSEGITELGLKKSATKLMPKRTTLLAITGATLGQVSLTEIEVCANQSVVGIYDYSKLYSEYIYLKINGMIEEIIRKAGGGAQQHINKSIVEETLVVLPDQKTIGRFNSLVRPLFDELSILLFKNQKLAETRDLLLPKLISGRIDVSKLDIKVPQVDA